MPFGVGLGSIAALARDVRAADEVPPPIRVYGHRAAELAGALAEGGDPQLVQVAGDPGHACAVVCTVDGQLDPGELAPLRAASREGTSLVAVRLDGTEQPVPYVLAMDVVAWTPGAPPPIAELVTRLAARLQRPGRLLAARLPLLRPPVERALASNAAVSGAAFVAVPWGSSVQLPVLSFMQARLLCDLETADGGPAPHAPDEVARVLAPRLGLATAVGVAARTTYRQVPQPLRRVAGPLIAYAGTRGLAAFASRLPLPR